jgi:hypothetical protein
MDTTVDLQHTASHGVDGLLTTPYPACYSGSSLPILDKGEQFSEVTKFLPYDVATT